MTAPGRCAKVEAILPGPVTVALLTSSECARVLARPLPMIRSQIVSSAKWWRRSIQAWLYRPQWGWLYETLEARLPLAEIDPGLRLNELQLVHYHAGGWYLNHEDNNAPAIAHRRYTFSIPLRNAMLGGGLTLIAGGLARKASSRIGHGTLFPAGLTHRADPVFAGLRVALVGWLSYPDELPLELARLQEENEEPMG